MANPLLPGGGVSPQSIYTTTTNKQHAVGTRGMLSDRVFYYSSMSNSTGVVANNLCQAAIPIANHVTQTGTLSFVAGRSSLTAVLGATAAIQDEYEEGYLYIQSSTLGLGQMRKIKGGHPAIASAGTLSVDLYDPVAITPTGTVTWTLIHNPWSNVIITPVTTITALCVGVAPVVIPAAAATTAPVYFWAQTWGVASILGDTSDTVVDSSLIPSAVVGSVGVAVETDIKQRIGISMGTLATNTVYQSVYLTIAP
jgi:hypothetical protein